MNLKLLSFIFITGFIATCALANSVPTKISDSSNSSPSRGIEMDISPAPGVVKNLSEITFRCDNGLFTSPSLSPVLSYVNPDGTQGDPITNITFSSRRGPLLDTSILQLDESLLQPGIYALKIPSSHYVVDRFSGEDEQSDIESGNIDDFLIISTDINFDGPTFRVLDIGNSYTMNSTEYLRQLIPEMGVDVSDICFYRAIFSGGSFKNWYDIYNNLNTDPYYIQRVFGDIRCNNLIESSQYNGCEALKTLLHDNEWDLIIIHQASRYASFYDSWQSQSDRGYLNELLDIIHEAQPGVPVGTHIIHGYGENSNYNSEKFSTRERWGCIASSAKRMQEDYDIKLLIPYGTAIENLRNSELNDETDLLEDGTHLSTGLARYAAACCYYETVFAPRFKKSMAGNTLRISGANDVTDDNASLVWKAVRSACENPFSITGNSEIITEPEKTFYYAYAPDPVPVAFSIVRRGDSSTKFQAMPGKEISLNLELDKDWEIKNATLLRWLKSENPENKNPGIDLHIVTDDDPVKEFESFSLSHIGNNITIPADLTYKDAIISFEVEYAGEISDSISLESGIKNVKDVDFFISNDKIYMHGLNINDHISVYTPAGILLKHFRAYSADMEIALDKGVYILQINDYAVKIIL